MANGAQNKADLARAYQRVFATDDGNRVLHDLLARFGFTDKTMFDADGMTLAYREGQRSTLVHIGTMQGINADLLEQEGDEDDDAHF